MQNRYFGDVGDFGKFGLLRALCGGHGEPRLKLGIVWYLVPDESHNADGKHTGYLQNERDYRNCDEPLFLLLRSLLIDSSGILSEKARQVLNAEMSGILPDQTQFYSEPLSYAPGSSTLIRLEHRRRWLARGLEAVEGAELVFLDPDNGIECESVSRTSAKGPKFVYRDEIEAFVVRGHNVLVYHHLGRSGSHAEQTIKLMHDLRERHPKHEVFALKFNRGSGRVYLLLGTPNHAPLFHTRIQRFLEGTWNRHFGDCSVRLGNLAVT